MRYELNYEIDTRGGIKTPYPPPFGSPQELIDLAEQMEAQRQDADEAEAAADEADAKARQVESEDLQAATEAARTDRKPPVPRAPGYAALAKEARVHAEAQAARCVRLMEQYRRTVNELLNDPDGEWTGKVLPAYAEAVTHVQEAVQRFHQAHAHKVELEGLLARLTGAHRVSGERYDSARLRRTLDQAANMPQAIRQLRADIDTLTEQDAA